MSLDALYQEIILDHYKNPRNFNKLDESREKAHFENPSCGDQIDLQIWVDENRVVQDIRFYGRGCAISQASASLMTEMVKGKTIDEVKDYIESFHSLVTGEGEITVDLGDLEALAGVRKFPVRVKCAMLGWTALKSLIKQYE
ncbi:MAG: SUF system NifU family Fe-S cluster assembly protein [Calditrichaeota bacterium]|nr:MAG: SUF system NifU family Fe-S cluster assembly protein [Calditrichota bacterium]